MSMSVSLLGAVEAILWLAGALACVVAVIWVQRSRGRFGTAETALCVALGLTAVWLLVGGVQGSQSGATGVAEGLRNLAWIFALYRLFAMDGRLESVRPVRPLLVTLALVEVLQSGSLTALNLGGNALSQDNAFRSLVSLRMLVVVGGLVLVHNLYAGAAQQARRTIRWPALTAVLLWGLDLNHYAIAFLTGDGPQAISALRGLSAAVAAGLLAIGAAEKSENLHFQPSRAVTFQSISLLLIAGYLALMVAVSQWLSFAGAGFGPLLQIAFVSAVGIAGAFVTLSPRLRGWLRVTLVKHLFRHRYDYRAEWLRFTGTIGHAGPDSAPLNERVIRAVADITDSPCGLLLVPGDTGALQLAARWNWDEAEVPSTALDQVSIRPFERDGFIADLDAERGGTGVGLLLPQWLHSDPRAWALVPLLHFGKLEGIVVLARPAHVRSLDWEDFDLLRVVGRQLASYLAEHAGQAALAEAAQFDEFHRRIAFVMHDIKNLASQLGLLARNAERHAENPAFRADMLLTLRNSTDKLNGLVARLSRYRPGSVAPQVPTESNSIARSVVRQFQQRHPVNLIEHGTCEVLASAEQLEQVLLHLVQNALDASPGGVPVVVTVGSDQIHGRLEVIDSGPGMSPDFVRSRLFRPFDSTKSGGFGIGAYEARELVRAMGGTLEVDSREGLGTRFTVILPLAQSAPRAMVA